MTTRQQLWNRVSASFWFRPACIVAASMAAAVALVELATVGTADLASWSPRLFGAGADGSRAMLSAIATSMITVAGVVFSITMVTLSLTATQYSPRVLRNFMRDTPTQLVLGTFVGVFAYCLVVLRTIRGGDEGAFIPSMAVLGGMVYAFVGIAVLIYFIHHVAQGVQAEAILSRIAADTREAIDRAYPQALGEEADAPRAQRVVPAAWQPVCAARSGYIASVDAEALLALARESGRVLRVARPVGDFVVEGDLLAAASGEAPADEALQEHLRACVVIEPQRTVEQDAAFGLQQLVDVGLRALARGNNDLATACMCLDRLGELLSRLAGRHFPSSERFADGELRVIAPAPSFELLVARTLGDFPDHAGGDLQVLERLLGVVERLEAATRAPSRREALGVQLGALRRELRRQQPRSRGHALRERAAGLERRLRATP